MLKIFNLKFSILFLLLTLSVIGWAVRHVNLQPAAVKMPKAQPVLKKDSIVYDKALVGRLESVFGRYNADKGNYTIKGNITMINKADTSEKMNHVSFLLSKKANEFYYKLGNTQTLNAGGVYLYIDNAPRTIMVSPQKPVVGDNGFQQLLTGGMTTNLRSEHYELSSTRQQGEQTISMINERHISCKQYSITIDTASLQIKKIFIRYTNFNAPLRTDNEKILTVIVDQWTNSAAPEQYLRAASVVLKDHDKYKATGKFVHYELINM